MKNNNDEMLCNIFLIFLFTIIILLQHDSVFSLPNTKNTQTTNSTLLIPNDAENIEDKSTQETTDPKSLDVAQPSLEINQPLPALPKIPPKKTPEKKQATPKPNNTNNTMFADVTKNSITKTPPATQTTLKKTLVKDEQISIKQTRKKIPVKKNIKYNDKISRDMEDAILTECHLTPEIIIDTDIPKHFNFSNNLKRKGGSPFVADGIPLFLYGRLTDELCTPIANAVVQIWHRNHYGIYQYEDVYSNPLYDRFFLGSGTYITNNLGQFNFLTIYPGKYKKEPISINIMVMHKDFIPMVTKIFLHQSELKELKEENLPISKNKLTNLLAKKVGDNTYKFNIALPGRYIVKE